MYTYVSVNGRYTAVFMSVNGPCTRHGPCTRPCNGRFWPCTWRVHDRVTVYTTSVHVCTCRRRCTWPMYAAPTQPVYPYRVHGPCTRYVHGRVHGPTRPVHGRVHRRVMAVYMYIRVHGPYRRPLHGRVRVHGPCTRPCKGGAHGPCTRLCAGRVHSRFRPCA